MPPPALLNCLGLWLLSAVIVHGQQTCADKSQSITLKKNLLCGYDRSVRPVKDFRDTIFVKITLYLKAFDFNERKNVLNLITWTAWTWHDDLLTWDKNQYNGQASLAIESYSIWVPDVTMTTAGEFGGIHHHMPSTTCYLAYDGRLTCVPPTTYAALCYPDLSRWPFDTQECSAEMSSWTHSGKQINLDITNEGIPIHAFEENRGWDLLTAEAKRVVLHYEGSNDSYQYLDFNFKLRRHSGSYAATVVIPALVLAIMTLLTFFLDSTSPARLNLGCMNVLAHCLYLQYLGTKLPSNGDSTPLIVAFFRDSLLLVGMSLFVTIVLRAMLRAERVPPAWVSSAVTWILESRPGQLLILSQLNPQGAATASTEDNDILVKNSSEKPKNSVWGFAAVFLDRVCLIVFTFTLFILLLAFVP